MRLVRMPDVRLLAAMVLVILGAGPALAQTATPASPPPQERFDPASISSSPHVQQLLGSVQVNQTTHSSVRPSKLRGHVGPSTAETVRLYWDLSLTRYWEIPRSAILLQVSGGRPGDPVDLYVPSTTAIVTATSMPAEAAMIQRALIDRLRKRGANIGANVDQPTTRNVASAVGEGILHSAAVSCLAGIPAGCFVSLGSGLAFGLAH